MQKESGKRGRLQKGSRLALNGDLGSGEGARASQREERQRVLLSD